jgi:hypothetical protein
MSRADEIIDVYPQPTFISNCQYDFKFRKHRILAWNSVGVCYLREEDQFTSIDVEFSNRNFHRNLVLADDFGISMATMNYTGLFMASKQQVTDMDDYEDDALDDDEMVDEMTKRKKSSNLQFKPLNERLDLKEWNYELPQGESVECLAIGSKWCVALTNANYLRVFSSDGIQLQVLS